MGFFCFQRGGYCPIAKHEQEEEEEKKTKKKESAAVAAAKEEELQLVKKRSLLGLRRGWYCWDLCGEKRKRAPSNADAAMVAEKDHNDENELIQLLGCCQISWKRVLRRLTEQVRKLLMVKNKKNEASAAAVAAHRFRYDPLSYSQNFDDGMYQHDPHAGHLRFRFTALPNNNNNNNNA